MSTSEYIVLLFSAISVTCYYNQYVLDMIIKWNLLFRGPHWKVVSFWKILQVEDIIGHSDYFNLRVLWYLGKPPSTNYKHALTCTREFHLNPLVVPPIFVAGPWYNVWIMSWILLSDFPKNTSNSSSPPPLPPTPHLRFLLILPLVPSSSLSSSFIGRTSWTACIEEDRFIFRGGPSSFGIIPPQILFMFPSPLVKIPTGWILSW